MKKFRFILFLFLMIISFGILCSCSGEQGPVGPQGEQGIQGPQGEPGKDGTSLFNGNGKPTKDLGKIGDSYIDLESWNYYVKTSGGWVLEGNIKGEVSDNHDGNGNIVTGDTIGQKKIYNLAVESGYNGTYEEWLEAVSVQVSNGYIQWKYNSETAWKKLISLSELGEYKYTLEDCNTDVMVVMSNSMEPTISTNDIIFGEDVPEGVLPLGTVVTFAVKSNEGYYLKTHRVVGYVYSYVNEEGKTVTAKEYYVKGEFEDKEDLDPSWTLLGYVTRGDKYTLELGASLDDCRVYNEDGKLVTSKDDAGYRSLDGDVLAVWKGEKIG